MGFQIAIDGPAGAGKSTVAKLISKELGYIYIDTGAMYRAFGLYLLNNNIAVNDEDAISKVVEKVNISIEFVQGEQKIYLNNEDVTDKIRTPEIGGAASSCSVHKCVREKLVALQQELASKQSVVMDGRDIGSVVLPNANVKIFLTASVEVRAKRRILDYKQKGIEKSLDEMIKEIEERDYRDTHRENSPLTRVKDAILIDSSNMSIDEVVDKIIYYADGGKH
jgi:cytidylate kinase